MSKNIEALQKRIVFRQKKYLQEINLDKANQDYKKLYEKLSPALQLKYFTLRKYKIFIKDAIRKQKQQIRQLRRNNDFNWKVFEAILYPNSSIISLIYKIKIITFSPSKPTETLTSSSLDPRSRIDPYLPQPVTSTTSFFPSKPTDKSMTPFELFKINHKNNPNPIEIPLERVQSPNPYQPTGKSAILPLSLSAPSTPRQSPLSLLLSLSIPL